MITKTLRIIASILLMLLPYLPIMEFSLGAIDHTNFSAYLFAGSIVGLVMVSLALFIRGGVGAERKPITLAAGLLCSLGFLILFPLHLGPPKENPELLQFLGIERFRYALLLLAVIIFCMACYLLLFSLKLHQTVSGWIFAILILIVGLFNLWDNYDSWSFGSQMNDWITQGKRAEDFFSSYNFHQEFRGISRILLYVGACGLCFLLLSQKRIKTWQALLIILFCGVGITFCVLCMTSGFSYYFPFMVPAVALAPAYWTGIVLLRQKSSSSPSTTI